MSIEFTIPSDNDPLHLADATVLTGRRINVALYMQDGIVVADAGTDVIDKQLEAAIIECYELAEAYA